MDKDISSGIGGGLPPPSGYSATATPFNVRPESPSSSASYPPLLVPAATSAFATFSHDISIMSDNPPGNQGHRRAHSEILTLPDDISFDNDLGIVGEGADAPLLFDDNEEDLLSIYLDMGKFNSWTATSGVEIGETAAGAGAGSSAATLLDSPPVSGAPDSLADNIAVSTNERPRVRHQHSQSMDELTSIKPDMLVSNSEDVSAADSKKATSAADLAELALIDPKRAKRIWANRQSAARSKEKKMRYISELEKKVQTLQTEATSLSTQLSTLQKDTNGLSTKNNELKLRKQSLEQQVQLQDALNKAVKNEIQHLRIMTGQTLPNGGPINLASIGGVHPFYPNNQAMHTHLTAQQFQQLQVHSQLFQQGQPQQFQQQGLPQQQLQLQQQKGLPQQQLQLQQQQQNQQDQPKH